MAHGTEVGELGPVLCSAPPHSPAERKSDSPGKAWLTDRLYRISLPVLPVRRGSRPIRRGGGPGRPRSEGRRPDQGPVRRPTAQARPRPGAHRQPRAHLPRRADHRVRPVRPARGVGRGARPVRRRRTVVLTTHYMDEAQALADTVVVLAAGRIVAAGPPDTLGGRDHGVTTVRFTLPADVSPTTCRSRRVTAVVRGGSVEFAVDEPTALRGPGRLGARPRRGARRADGACGLARGRLPGADRGRWLVNDVRVALHQVRYEQKATGEADGRRLHLRLPDHLPRRRGELGRLVEGARGTPCATTSTWWWPCSPSASSPPATPTWRWPSAPAGDRRAEAHAGTPIAIGSYMGGLIGPC